MKPQPKDKNLYNKVKQKIIFRNKQHSAYRSGRIVSEYKKQYKLKNYPLTQLIFFVVVYYCFFNSRLKKTNILFSLIS